MIASTHLSRALWALNLLLLLLLGALAGYAWLSAGENRYYTAEVLAFDEQGQAAAAFALQVRRSGERIFIACSDGRDGRAEEAYGRVTAELGDYSSLLIDDVLRPQDGGTCSAGEFAQLPGLVFFKGEIVQIRSLHNDAQALCFHHQEANLVRCLAKQ